MNRLTLCSFVALSACNYGVNAGTPTSSGGHASSASTGHSSSGSGSGVIYFQPTSPCFDNMQVYDPALGSWLE